MVCYVNGITPSFGNEKTAAVLQKEKAGTAQNSPSEKIQQELRRLYEEAKKARNADDLKLLEEKEKELEAEKVRIETELNLKNNPHYYENMSITELHRELKKAVDNNLPQVDIIKAEIRKRMFASLKFGLAE